MIKTNPITSHHINIHTENDLCNWFETEYQSAVQYMGIKRCEGKSHGSAKHI